MKQAHHYTTDQFHCQPVDKTFTAEASSIGGVYWNNQQHIILQSHVSNAITAWELYHTSHDREGDVCYWVFVPSRGTITLYPKLNNWQIVILND